MTNLITLTESTLDTSNYRIIVPHLKIKSTPLLEKLNPTKINRAFRPVSTFNDLHTTLFQGDMAGNATTIQPKQVTLDTRVLPLQLLLNMKGKSGFTSKGETNRYLRANTVNKIQSIISDPFVIAAHGSSAGEIMDSAKKCIDNIEDKLIKFRCQGIYNKTLEIINKYGPHAGVAIDGNLATLTGKVYSKDELVQHYDNLLKKQGNSQPIVLLSCNQHDCSLSPKTQSSLSRDVYAAKNIAMATPKINPNIPNPKGSHAHKLIGAKDDLIMSTGWTKYSPGTSSQTLHGQSDFDPYLPKSMQSNFMPRDIELKNLLNNCSNSSYFSSNLSTCCTLPSYRKLPDCTRSIERSNKLFISKLNKNWKP